MNIINLAEHHRPVIYPLQQARECNDELTALALVDKGRLSDIEIQRRTGLHLYFIRSYREIIGMAGRGHQ